ncbi:MAG TPA: c-type cytochrome [Acidobacteriaceae bacterium]|jgi:cytochrome c|nr:c-type cytochrome [Acidobacteriaceae bacterium]
MTFRTRIRDFAAAVIFGILVFSAVVVLCDGHALCASAQEHGNDGAPLVKVTAPADNSTYSWKSLVNYSIVVSYLGKSTQYQEIPSNQVLLKATYVADLSTHAPAAAVATPDGLLDIVRSNCLGCHEFKAKAMGPSFAAIAQRYPDNPAAIDTLSRYIRAGSTGVWGPGSMPPHPEFTEDQLHAIVLWILKEAASPNVNYYVGTEGAIRMEAPVAPAPRAGLILTASYTAVAPDAGPEKAPFGMATVIVRGK